MNYKKNTKTFEKYTKIERVIKFGDTEAQKQQFHQHKRPISIKNMGINKIRV